VARKTGKKTEWAKLQAQQDNATGLKAEITAHAFVTPDKVHIGCCYTHQLVPWIAANKADLPFRTNDDGSCYFEIPFSLLREHHWFKEQTTIRHEIHG
jgi:hypothetical protein